MAKTKPSSLAPIDNHIGRRLRRRRKLLGMTQTALAELLDMQFQQVQKYECGANRITASRLYQLAQALSCPVQYFYDGLGPANDSKDEAEEQSRALAEQFRSLTPDQRACIERVIHAFKQGQAA